MDTLALIAQAQRDYNLTRSAAEQLVREAMSTARKRKQVSAREAKRRATDYLTFLNDASPELDWNTAFARYIAKVVDQVIDGELLNVAISLPPRIGKSQAVTIRLPVYWLERNPRDKVIVGAYNHTLAKLFTGESMRLFRQRNPADIDSEQEDEWTTINGGMCIGVGVGSGATGKGAHCFPAGTMISTPDGDIDIAELAESAQARTVYCYDHVEGKLAVRPVIACRKIMTDGLIRIATRRDYYLYCTADHPVYVPSKGYVQAIDLRLGDYLLTRHEELDSVDELGVARGSRPVYDLQVEEHNNFFANNILVHNCIILDDVVKSHAEAFSKAYRERVWNWYLSDIRSRRNNLAKVPQIIIGTRWHRSDLIGRVLEESEPGEWVEIRIPAIARENDPLGRSPGESINEERLPLRMLEREKRLLGPRFESLYQQDPIDESGTLFDIDKLVEVQGVPREAHRVRFWDRAASEGKGDWTVGILMAYDDNGIIHIEDIIRDRIGKDAVRARMKSTLIDDLQRYGNIEGYTFKTYFEREPGGDGLTAAEDIVKAMAPYPIYWDRSADNKTARCAGFAVAVNAGNVRIKIGPWIRDFKDELARFVEGIDNKQDDQVDAAAGAYNKLAIENAIITVS